jgi:hypothetical protein
MKDGQIALEPDIDSRLHIGDRRPACGPRRQFVGSAGRFLT